MKQSIFISFPLILLFACNQKPKDDPTKYYNVYQLDSLKTSIVTYLFDAPPYTQMKDRFDIKHRSYYSGMASQFDLNKLVVAEDGKHYFYIIRPAPYPKKNRGVGGFFYVDSAAKGFQLKGFRELFVTPILPEEEVKGRCSFLFQEMIDNKLKDYLPMETYIQWPNKVSYYDSTSHEWKLKSGF
jgi:hypothetical protein